MQKSDDELREFMCKHFKEWGYTIGSTDASGRTNICVHHKNIAFVTSLLRNAGFENVIVKSM